MGRYVKTNQYLIASCQCWSEPFTQHILATQTAYEKWLNDRAMNNKCISAGLSAAFKFGRRVHFALRRKMLKPPIARLPAI